MTDLQEKLNEMAQEFKQEFEQALRNGHDVDGVSNNDAILLDGVCVSRKIGTTNEFCVVLCFESDDIADYLYDPKALYAKLHAAEDEVRRLKEQLHITEDEK